MTRSLIILFALLGLAPHPLVCQETYEGRPLAQTMSYRGAPWLERETREEEERPARVLEAMALEDGETVVDLGCGSGFYSRRLAKAVGEEGRVYGVDIQPEMLEILRRNAAAEGIDNIVPVLGTQDRLNLPGEIAGSVDWILLVDVYHELSDPASMLEEMRQALAPDGHVALVEYRLEGPTAQHIKVDHRMSVDQVLKEWEPAGFELVELIEDLPSQHLFVFAKRP